MNDNTLTVFGSLNLDLVCRVRRLPVAGETVSGTHLTRLAGGKGANQAVAAAGLGGDVRLVGCVGADADGTWLRDQVRQAGVDVTGVRTADTPTGLAVITVDDRGENQIVAVPGANADVDASAVNGRDGDALLCQLEIPTAAVLSAALRFPGYVALNAAPARQLPPELLERADLIIVNETEYAAMPELADVRSVAVTYGARGAVLLERGRPIAGAVPPEVTAVDSVGAGDAFCAALVLGLHSGVEPARALRAACAAGAIAVSQPGPQPHLPPIVEVLADDSVGAVR